MRSPWPARMVECRHGELKPRCPCWGRAGSSPAPGTTVVTAPASLGCLRPLGEEAFAPDGASGVVRDGPPPASRRGGDGAARAWGVRVRGAVGVLGDGDTFRPHAGEAGPGARASLRFAVSRPAGSPARPSTPTAGSRAGGRLRCRVVTRGAEAAPGGHDGGRSGATPARVPVPGPAPDVSGRHVTVGGGAGKTSEGIGEKGRDGAREAPARTPPVAGAGDLRPVPGGYRVGHGPVPCDEGNRMVA